MRLGSLIRLVRTADHRSLRRFASSLDLPFSTISALEAGWLPPGEVAVDRLVRYLALTAREPQVLTRWHQFLASQYTREYVFRVTCDTYSNFPLTLAGAGVLKAFLDLDSYAYDFPGHFLRMALPPDKASWVLQNFGPRELESQCAFFLVITLRESMAQADAPTEVPARWLAPEARFRLTMWLLHDHGGLIRLRDAHRFPLTQPPKRIQKILSDLLGPVSARDFSGFYHLQSYLAEPGIPDWVPLPFLALDLLLLLADRVILDPLVPGRMTVELLSQSGKRKQVVAYHPPHVRFPGIDPGAPSLEIVDLPDGSEPS